MAIRFLVPVVAAVVVLVLPITLIGVMVNSPYTHANLEHSLNPSYIRTEVSQLGAPVLFQGAKLAVNFSPTTPLEDRGKALLVTHGCGSCHGIDGKGGVVAPPIMTDIEVIREMVRRGPGGMPVYSSQELTDYDVMAIAVYLQSVNK